MEQQLISWLDRFQRLPKHKIRVRGETTGDAIESNVAKTLTKVRSREKMGHHTKASPQVTAQLDEVSALKSGYRGGLTLS